ncbi:glycosyltransferase family 2 protein [Pseudonocardia adelaidensis]|uniref:Glycosyltransferase 2-like domain-containing protein n=1 Tax=Pseudonocardia adelaidensis TaxID=648754 RepID=A0ABP9N6L8_9PSEU
MASPVEGITELELTEPMPDLVSDRPEGEAQRTRLLLRLHTHPVGELTLALGPGGIAADDLAATIWRVAAGAVREHLRADGLPTPGRLDPGGLDTGGEPACTRRRRALRTAAPPMSVLLATRDRTASLLRCLDSVARLDYPQFDVVIVDSAPSTDDTALAIESLRSLPGMPPIHYTRAELPGLGFAHNRGLDLVTGSWVAITDDDVTVDPHWLTGILEGFSTARAVACVTGPIMAAELQTPAQQLLEQYGGYNRGFIPRCYNMAERRPPDPLFPFAVGRLGSGANMAYRTAFLREIGGFDPATGVGTPARSGDDFTGFLQVLLSGHTLAYQPAALLWHWHPREFDHLRRMAHGYGVGLGAYLTSTVAHRPSLLPVMLRSLVPGARHLLSRKSAKNVAKQADFPRSVELAEVLGLLRGPFAYAHSWHRYRGSRGWAALEPTAPEPTGADSDSGATPDATPTGAR